jgi:hypothetical protein
MNAIRVPMQVMSSAISTLSSPHDCEGEVGDKEVSHLARVTLNDEKRVCPSVYRYQSDETSYNRASGPLRSKITFYKKVPPTGFRATARNSELHQKTNPKEWLPCVAQPS